MPLNNSYDEQAVIQAIASALETFYGTLIEKIDGLNIQKVMKRKNPYLYRAKAMQSATEIVDSVLTAFVSSSEETIFGNCFFEPIAIAASGGNKALAEGIDIMIQNNETNTISDPKMMRSDRKIIPDLVIHRRRSNRNNLLVIEFKKKNAETYDKENDRNKLMYLTDQKEDFKYNFGLFVELGSHEVYMEVYQEGNLQTKLNYSITY